MPSRPPLALLWLGILVPLFLLTLFADWYGNVRLICLMGIITLAFLFQFYFETKRLGETLIERTSGHPLVRRLNVLLLATLAGWANFTTDLNLHFAGEDRGTFVDGMRTFDYFGHWEIFALLILGGIAQVTSRISENVETVGSKAVKFLGTFQFIISFYLLLCGLLVGREGIKAALQIFNISWTDPWPLTTKRQFAAIFLYEHQGPVLFYVLFAGLPSVWLVISISRWIAKTRPRPTIAGRGFVVCGCLLILAASMSARTNTFLVHHLAILVLQRSSEPLDKELASCLSKVNPSEIADVECAKKWEAAWEGELSRNSQALMKKTSRDGRTQFTRQEAAWRNSPPFTTEATEGRSGERFIVILQRGDALRERTTQYRKLLGTG